MISRDAITSEYYVNGRVEIS